MRLPDRRWLFGSVGLLLVLGSFLRLYRIEDTLMFQGDQGRDALVVAELLGGDPVLLGPVTSVGNMYLGPLYYYFMAPFLAMSYPNPVGPAIGVALANIALLVLVWLIGRRFFGDISAFIALYLLSVNQVLVGLSRFSWNPNIAPLLAFLVFVFGVTYLRTWKWWWAIATAIALGMLNQTHYMTLLMFSVPIAMIGYGLFARRSNWLYMILLLGGCVVAYGLTYAPLVVFDVRSGGLIRNGFGEYFGDQREKGTTIAWVIKTLREVEGRSFRILAQLNGSTSGLIDRVVSYGTVVLFGWLIYLKKLTLRDPALLLLVAWVGGGIVGSAVYPDSIFDHYLAYLIPGVAMLAGVMFGQVWRISWIGKVLVTIGLGIYLVVNMIHPAAFAQAGPNGKHYARIVSEIVDHIPEGKFNIALISESRDWRGMNYRYFLATRTQGLAHYEDYDGLTSLVLIDEQRVEDPLGYQTYEIQQPGLDHVRETLEIPGGPRVYIVTVE